MSGFVIALSFLTRLPVPSVDAEKAGNIALAAPWLPVVGAIVGAFVALAVWLLAGIGAWVGALVGLLVWVLITGALHLDGLGDVADGLGAAHGNPERFIAVARDPHLGSFGAVAIVLQLAAKLVLLAAVTERLGLSALVPALILLAAWARWGTLVLGRAVKPLAEGMASRLAAGIDTRVVIMQGAALAVLTAYLAPVLLLAVPFTAVLAIYWRARLGGITGDCHGASIEIMETALLFALLLR
jgi:adenosylcobinamide-GDP ribazoletransferase